MVINRSRWRTSRFRHDAEKSGGLRVDGRFGNRGKPFVCHFLFVKSLRQESQLRHLNRASRPR